MRFIITAVMVWFCGGCMVFHEDPKAEQAVKDYDALMRYNVPEELSLAGAVATVPSEKHSEIHREFAGLHRAEILDRICREQSNYRKLNQVLFEKECARIRLNVLLGISPEKKIKYNTGGAFEVPDELPDVKSIAKAAMVIAGSGNDLFFLERIYLAHAAAVAAYDRFQHASTPEEKVVVAYERVAACADLAAAAKMTWLELPGAGNISGRFDVLTSH